MSELTRSEIRANREKWARFLMKPGRKKARRVLDAGSGVRCCIGHGCFTLGVERQSAQDNARAWVYGAVGRRGMAPDEFVELVGLYDDCGETDSTDGISLGCSQNCYSLTELNDLTNATPQDIGEYLLSVIEGGPSTPFKPLSEYKEEQS